MNRTITDTYRYLAHSFKDDCERLTRTVNRLRERNKELRAENEELKEQWAAQQDRDDAWIAQQLGDRAELDIAVTLDDIDRLVEPFTNDESVSS